jgi:hypothetical protein
MPVLAGIFQCMRTRGQWSGSSSRRWSVGGPLRHDRPGQESSQCSTGGLQSLRSWPAISQEALSSKTFFCSGVGIARGWPGRPAAGQAVRPEGWPEAEMHGPPRHFPEHAILPICAPRVLLLSGQVAIRRVGAWGCESGCIRGDTPTLPSARIIGPDWRENHGFQGGG